MAKAISILVSVTLLVVADRAAAYWQRTHLRACAQAEATQIQQAAHQIAPRPRIIPIHIAPEIRPTTIQL